MTTSAPSYLEVLSDSLTYTMIRNRAGYRAFKKGEEDFDAGAVKSVKEVDGRVIASVALEDGLATVEFAPRDGAPEPSIKCSCTGTEPERLCRHQVAAALSVLYDDFPEEEEPEDDVSDSQVRAYLEGLSRESLLLLLWDRARCDDDLRHLLAVRACAACPEGERGDILKRKIDDLFKLSTMMRGFEVWMFKSDVEQFLDALEEVLDKLTPDEALEVAEHALDAALAAMASIDDEDGDMEEIFARLIKVHVASCQRANVKGEDLAEKIFRMEMEDAEGAFLWLIKEYKDVIGPRGLSRYKELAESAWAKVPPLELGERDQEYCGRPAITPIMEALAELDQDVDCQIQVKARDLSSTDGYLDIAQTLDGHGRRKEALEWAERGLELSGSMNEDLFEFLLDLYVEDRRVDEAMNLLWRRFESDLDLESFGALKDHAVILGTWPAWRDRGLALMQSELERKENAARPKKGQYGPDPSSTLVWLLLEEELYDRAWEVAKRWGCMDRLWDVLVESREKTHPDDVLSHYQKKIERLVQKKEHSAFTEAVELLVRLRGLFSSSGKEPEFTNYLNSLRHTHRNKKELARLMKDAGL